MAMTVTSRLPGEGAVARRVGRRAVGAVLDVAAGGPAVGRLGNFGPGRSQIASRPRCVMIEARPAFGPSTPPGRTSGGRWFAHLGRCYNGGASFSLSVAGRSPCPAPPATPERKPLETNNVSAPRPQDPGSPHEARHRLQPPPHVRRREGGEVRVHREPRRAGLGPADLPQLPQVGRRLGLRLAGLARHGRPARAARRADATLPGRVLGQARVPHRRGHRGVLRGVLQPDALAPLALLPLAGLLRRGLLADLRAHQSSCSATRSWTSSSRATSSGCTTITSSCCRRC